MNTLAKERALARHVKSLERKNLKRRMDGYNVLARAAGVSPVSVSGDSPDTIHDIAQHAAHVCQVRPLDRVMHRARILHPSQHIVSREVRNAWHARVGLITGDSPSDGSRFKLMTPDNLAKYLVHLWCDVDGYDPTLHSPDVLAHLRLTDGFSSPFPLGE